MCYMSDSFISKDKLFHSRVAFREKDFKNSSLHIKGMRSELFHWRLYKSMLFN